MRSAVVLVPALLACLACCRPRAAPPPDAGRPAPSVVTATAPDAGASAPTVSLSPSPSAGLPRSLRGVEITSLGAGRIEIVGTGSGTESVRLAPTARLERVSADGTGTFTPVTNLDGGGGYRLRASCGVPQAEVAVPLAPGEKLRPVPWTGFECSAQCTKSCRANVFHGPGAFRFVVQSEAGEELASPTFVMPAADHASLAALERWALAEGVAKVTATRVAFPPGMWDERGPARADRIAGLVPRGAGRALDPASVQELVERLRDARGFDDTVQKRCQMGTMVGFRVARTLPSTGAPHEETMDLAIDFACQKLFAVRGEREARVVYATHFDPSRAAFLALARRALPDDEELASLK